MKKCKIQWLLCALVVTLMACGSSHAKQNEEASSATEEVAVSDNQTPTPDAEQHKIVSGELNVISSDEFVKLITDIDNPKGFQYKGTTPCIVDFYADWCGPCHALNPTLQDMAVKYKDKILVYKVNVDKSAVVAQAFNISSIPTLIFFTAHTQPAMIVGAPAREDLETAIKDLLLK